MTCCWSGVSSASARANRSASSARVSSTVAVELTRALDADLLARALGELTPDQQQVIVMKFLEGLDNEQIAETMDKREGAIRALQMRALMSLRRVLEHQGEFGQA